MPVVKLRDESAKAASTLVAQLGNRHAGFAERVRDEG
jgi:hypothetical protein